MKKFYKYFYTLFLFVAITSCSSDGNGIDDPTDDEPAIDRSLNKKGLGDSAHDLLSDDTYTSIKIEVLYVDGYQPTVAAMNNFKAFLEERVYKPDGISISSRPVASSGLAPFEIQESTTLILGKLTNRIKVGTNLKAQFLQTSEKFALDILTSETSYVWGER